MIIMSEEVVEELLSFKDFVEKYKNENAFSVISYELYLIAKKLDKVIDNEDTEI